MKLKMGAGVGVVIAMALALMPGLAAAAIGTGPDIAFDLDDFPLATPPAGMAAVQALAYITLLGSCGLMWFRAFCVGRIDDRSRTLSDVMAIVTILLHLILIPYIRVWEVGGHSQQIFDAEMWRVSPWASSIRGLGTLIIGMPIQMYFARKDMAVRKNRWWLFIGGILALGSLTVVGHTANLPPTWMTHGSDFIHGLGATFWFGGLWGLIMYLRQVWSGTGDAVESGRVVTRFSQLALWSVVALAGSGTVMALKVMGGITHITDTPFGRTLIVKLLVVVIPVAMAAWNRFRLMPDLERSESTAAWATLRKSILVEGLLLILILCITGVLVLQNPVP